MISYESARPQDLPLLFQLNKQLIDAYEDTAAIDYDRVLQWLQRNLEENLASFRRVLYRGELAGFFCLTRQSEKMELDSLFVLPRFQGKGIGTQVLRHCQSRSPSLFLYVFRRNERAIALYQRMGFRITKEVGTTRYIMEYSLFSSDSSPG